MPPTLGCKTSGTHTMEYLGFSILKHFPPELSLFNGEKLSSTILYFTCDVIYPIYHHVDCIPGGKLDKIAEKIRNLTKSHENMSMHVPLVSTDSFLAMAVVVRRSRDSRRAASSRHVLCGGAARPDVRERVSTTIESVHRVEGTLLFQIPREIENSALANFFRSMESKRKEMGVDKVGDRLLITDITQTLYEQITGWQQSQVKQNSPQLLQLGGA